MYSSTVYLRKVTGSVTYNVKTGTLSIKKAEIPELPGVYSRLREKYTGTNGILVYRYGIPVYRGSDAVNIIYCSSVAGNIIKYSSYSAVYRWYTAAPILLLQLQKQYCSIPGVLKYREYRTKYWETPSEHGHTRYHDRIQTIVQPYPAPTSSLPPRTHEHSRIPASHSRDHE
jgi:hypothetical protein